MSYVESAEGAAGPFYVEASLMSQDSRVMYARGNGQASPMHHGPDTVPFRCCQN